MASNALLRLRSQQQLVSESGYASNEPVSENELSKTSITTKISHQPRQSVSIPSSCNNLGQHSPSSSNRHQRHRDQQQQKFVRQQSHQLHKVAYFTRENVCGRRRLKTRNVTTTSTTIAHSSRSINSFNILKGTPLRWCSPRLGFDSLAIWLHVLLFIVFALNDVANGEGNVGKFYDIFLVIHFWKCNSFWRTIIGQKEQEFSFLFIWKYVYSGNTSYKTVGEYLTEKITSILGWFIKNVL